MLRKRSEALKVEAKNEEEKLLLQKWKDRAEVKRAGAEYTPWATHMWKQGKQISTREPDIVVLEDKKTKEIFKIIERKKVNSSKRF